MPIQTALLFETPQQIYTRVFQELRPRTPAPRVEIAFCRFANANSTAQWHEGNLRIRMTDVLENAPAPVIEALAFILLSKLFRRRIPSDYSHRYNRYLNRRDVRHTLQRVRQERGRKLIAAPQGAVYNLEHLFEELNFEYFNGLMARPTIGWSRKAARGSLGHYDPSHNTIVISKLLDRSEVPSVVVEYVMFHEILHLRFPAEHRGARRCVHTRDFKAAEKQFPHLAEAKQALSRLLR